MAKNELVSILIQTYNRKKIVVKAIESALSQTYKNIEVIVSDNFSSDGTFEYLHSKYFENKKLEFIKILKILALFLIGSIV